MNGRIGAIVVALCLFVAVDLTAQDAWSFAFGGFGMLMNTYPGSDEYDVSVMPEVKIAYAKGPVTFGFSLIDGVGFTYANPEIHLLVSLNLFLGSERDSETYAVGFFRKDHSNRIARRLADTPTVSTIAYGELALGYMGPVGIFGATVEYHPTSYEGDSNEFYHGIVSSVYYLLPFPVTDRLMVTGKFAVDFMDARYAEAWYSLPEDTAELDAFRAEPGIKDVKLYLRLDYLLAKHVGVIVLASDTLLLGDAGRTPLTSERNQLMFGLCAVYKL